VELNQEDITKTKINSSKVDESKDNNSDDNQDDKPIKKLKLVVYGDSDSE